MRVTWVQPEDLLPHELAASRDEGRDVQAIADRWAAAGGSLTPPVGGASDVPAHPPPPPVDSDLRELAAELLDACDALPDPPSLVADEPDGPPLLVVGEPDGRLSLVVVGEPDGRPLLVVGEPDGRPALAWPASSPRPADLDRILGAWRGRAAGCLLGKPVEKIPREGIREILAATGRWPLTGYFTGAGLPAQVAQRWPWNRRSAGTSLVENIDGMPEDDDLNYPLIALWLLERHGAGFSSADVATAWLELLPAGRTFTAERVAYRNLLLGLAPPATARRHNPFREWIGAAIRTDLYGWVNPGRPDRAANLAWRDAVVSHTRGGVYGALWVAAMTSAAVMAPDLDTVLDAGESVLPPHSRFAAAVRQARALAVTQPDWEAIVDDLYARHGHLHWVHGRSNAALVTAALVHGRADFSRSICAVVSGGWDTDSNGATVGSVVGALTGAAALPAQWTDPLRDRLHTSVPGFDGITFSELASRSARLVEILDDSGSDRGQNRPGYTNGGVA